MVGMHPGLLLNPFLQVLCRTNFLHVNDRNGIIKSTKYCNHFDKEWLAVRGVGGGSTAAVVGIERKIKRNGKQNLCLGKYWA